MQEIEHKIPGNAEVIDGLEKALERAKSGLGRAVAIVFCEHGGADVMYLGDVHARAQVVYGCNLMIQLLVSSTSMNVRPLVPTIGADFVKYDLSSDPICFDFIPWLVTAKMKMIQEGAPGPLKVAFIRNPTSLAPITDQKWTFFNKVIRPSLELFGAVEDAAAAEGRHEEFAGLRDIAAGFKTGVYVPKIEVPERALLAMAGILEGRRPVTITLRESPSYMHRNSDTQEWRKLARWLEHRGESVIVVRDTAKATERWGNFDICPEASTDILMRAALYELAKCNLFVTNGPWGLAYFGTKPWLMFASIDDDQPEQFNRPAWWNMFMGLNSDKQIPWSSPQQRIVYKRDTFDNMRNAYEALQLS